MIPISFTYRAVHGLEGSHTHPIIRWDTVRLPKYGEFIRTTADNRLNGTELLQLSTETVNNLLGEQSIFYS